MPGDDSTNVPVRPSRDPGDDCHRWRTSRAPGRRDRRRSHHWPRATQTAAWARRCRRPVCRRRATAPRAPRRRVRGAPRPRTLTAARTARSLPRGRHGRRRRSLRATASEIAVPGEPQGLRAEVLAPTRDQTSRAAHDHVYARACLIEVDGVGLRKSASDSTTTTRSSMLVTVDVAGGEGRTESLVACRLAGQARRGPAGASARPQTSTPNRTREARQPPRRRDPSQRPRPGLR